MENLKFDFAKPPIWTVTQVTRRIKTIIAQDITLQDIWIQGEVSNFTRARSGHLYFTMKDESAELSCVMWKITALKQIYIPKDGDQIEVHGRIEVYENRGTYQLYADNIRPLGEGALYLEFLRLKDALEKEGLFDEEHKRALPEIPQVIGVVTSPTGAALQDIKKTIMRRFPLVELVISPATVQGDKAPGEIIEALDRLNTLVNPDVIILARGGGSIEDLWAFNDEGVVRAVYSSKNPVVCGVGHATDSTLADFSADVRAPTPTAAAEICTPDQADLGSQLLDHSRTLYGWINTYMKDWIAVLTNITTEFKLISPRERINSLKQRMDEIDRSIHSLATLYLSNIGLKLESRRDRLDALNPKKILDRGYAYITDEKGSHVRSVDEVEINQALSVEISDGKLKVRTEDKTKNE